MNPKAATQAITADPGLCTTRAGSSRSRYGNVTQWCAYPLFLLGYHYTLANAMRAKTWKLLWLPFSSCCAIRRPYELGSRYCLSKEDCTRVPFELFFDEELYQLELERIFG